MAQTSSLYKGCIDMVSFKEHMKTLVKLDMTAAALMYVGNKTINSLSTAKNMLKPGTGKYFKWKYGDVFYHKFGEGTPLLLLHELGPANSCYEWQEVMDDLARNHTVYAVDLPGCGRSAKPKLTYTNYFYVLFLKDFIRKIIKVKTDILADGYSSSFAIMAMASDPTLIHHITAVNPYSIKNLSQTESTRSRFAKFILTLPVLGTTIYNIDQSHRNIDYKFTEEYLYNPFRSNDRFVDAYYEGSHYHEGNGKYLLASIKGLYMTVNIKPALKKAGDRISILYGAGIDHNHELIVKNYININRNIKAYGIPKTKVIPMMESPKEFIKVYKKSEQE